MINLLLADDHLMLREGLRRKFDDADGIRVTGEANTAAELMKLLRHSSADVLILDIKLPDANGIALIKDIRKVVPAIKVVILTMYDHPRYAIEAMESGADGFVVKGAPFEVLVRAVKSAYRGQKYICPQVASKLAGDQTGSRKKSGLADQLSKREFEVFTMLAGGHSLKDIGNQMGISEKTVSTYRTRLLAKLDLANNSDIVRMALESDLID